MISYNVEPKDSNPVFRSLRSHKLHFENGCFKPLTLFDHKSDEL